MRHRASGMTTSDHVLVTPHHVRVDACSHRHQMHAHLFPLSPQLPLCQSAMTRLITTFLLLRSFCSSPSSSLLDACRSSTPPYPPSADRPLSFFLDPCSPRSPTSIGALAAGSSYYTFFDPQHLLLYESRCALWFAESRPTAEMCVRVALPFDSTRFEPFVTPPQLPPSTAILRRYLQQRCGPCS